MKHALVACLLLLPSLAAADRVIDADKSGAIDCAKDPEIVINKAGGTFTFTGTCDKIAVNGATNKLTIENVKHIAIVGASNTVDINGADKIAVTGSNNTITYKTAVNGKGKPKVASIGTGNKITKK